MNAATDSQVQSGPRDLVILGCTGSIGTQALDVVAAHPGRFTVRGLSAAGSDPALLARQAVDHGVETVTVLREDAAEALSRELHAHARAIDVPSTALPQVTVGEQAVAELAGMCDEHGTVLNGITGSAGLAPTLAALRSGATLALANKESLVIGGTVVLGAQARPGQVVPVDSEHSAIAQALSSGRHERGMTATGRSGYSEVSRLVLTASGGPFRGWSRADLAAVTPEQALAHPNFAMGRVVTTNSATMVNKALEVIEAHLLFDVPLERIDVVVHPQQWIHSMVEFHDGSTLAQAGPPRMLVPIALGLSWPERLPEVDRPMDWSAAMSWDFAPLDEVAFPAVRLAKQAAATSPTHMAVFNAANEVCVDAFHDGQLAFPDIVDTVAAVLAAYDSARSEMGARPSSTAALDLAAVLDADAWGRRAGREMLTQGSAGSRTSDHGAAGGHGATSDHGVAGGGRR